RSEQPDDLDGHRVNSGPRGHLKTGQSGSGPTKRGRTGLPAVESRKGAVSEPIRNRPVSPPRSSNRTCPFRTSSFPTGFTAAPTRAVPVMVPGDDTEDCSLRTATQRDREVVRIAAVL